MTNENRELSLDELARVSGSIDGISRLVTVTQTKANNANDAALAGAEGQRGLVQEQLRRHQFR